MSKEPGSKGRFDTGGEGARRRRRRRGSALRVPSDSVPRAASERDESGESPAPPEPESPELAVSLAAAFGDSDGDSKPDDGAMDGDASESVESSPAGSGSAADADASSPAGSGADAAASSPTGSSSGADAAEEADAAASADAAAPAEGATEGATEGEGADAAGFADGAAEAEASPAGSAAGAAASAPAGSGADAPEDQAEAASEAEPADGAEAGGEDEEEEEEIVGAGGRPLLPDDDEPTAVAAIPFRQRGDDGGAGPPARGDEDEGKGDREDSAEAAEDRARGAGGEAKAEDGEGDGARGEDAEPAPERAAPKRAASVPSGVVRGEVGEGGPRDVAAESRVPEPEKREPEPAGGDEEPEIPVDVEPPPRRVPRASTEALSEEELEELIEPIEDEPLEGKGAGEGDPAAPADTAGDEDFDALETAQFVPVVVEEPTEEAGASGRGQAARDAGDVPTAVTVLERQAFGAPGERAEGGNEPSARGGRERARSDPGDSGEILSEELIEEIDDAAPTGADEGAYAFEGTGPTREADAAARSDGAAGAVDAGEGSASADAGARPPDPPPVPENAPKPPPAPSVTSGRQGAHGKAWFDEVFDEDYLRTLPFLTPQATQAEAKFVVESLGLGPGAQVLDVGCGYGRHAMELAARGCHVVGLDNSLPLLLRGADEAGRRGLTINFVHGDMRELTFEAQFDGAFCLFSTFGYFDDEMNKLTAQNIAHALKPGGRFVVEVLNRDYLIQDLPTRVWWEGDGCVVLEEVEFNYFSSRIVSNRSVLFDDGRQLEHEISIRAYSLHELGKLLQASGFRVLEVSGSMHTRGRFFGAQARDIIVLAERRGSGE